jgi:hypothetical protein
MKVQSETPGAGKQAAASSPAYLARIMDEGAHAKQEIVSVDETALYWEMSFRTS